LSVGGFQLQRPPIRLSATTPSLVDNLRVAPLLAISTRFFWQETPSELGECFVKSGAASGEAGALTSTHVDGCPNSVLQWRSDEQRLPDGPEEASALPVHGLHRVWHELDATDALAAHLNALERQLGD
jgi:hypothetical protein